MIYLDNSATTRVREEVIEAMQPYLCQKWGNPSSIHKMGRQSRAAVDVARQQLADFINAKPDEIYFSPCGTYANNGALLGYALYAEEQNLGRHLITTCIEHSSSLGPAKQLQARGWKVSYVHVNEEALIDIAELESLITDETSIISVMWANNEVGTVQPVEEIGKIAGKHGIFFHSDAVQAAGKLRLDVGKVAVKTMSLSGHKFHAPKGIGVLFVRQGIELRPIIHGGGQERGLFPGTENLAHIVAIGKAAEMCRLELEDNIQKLRSIQELMIAKLTQCPGVRLTGASDMLKRLPGHISVIVEGAIGEELVIDADLEGVCISSVSACKQSGQDPSHVLKCIGFPAQQMLGSARITAGSFNTIDECEAAADILSEIFLAHAKVSKPNPPGKQLALTQ